MKRFSLMAAISALLGSSISEASPAFKKYKDALAAYKKTPSENNADVVIAAYEALGGPRGLRGDILARDQYAAIAVGKDGAVALKARRKLLKDAKRGGAGVADKTLLAQIADLQRDLAAIKTTEAALKNDKTVLEADLAKLRGDFAAKTTDLATALADVVRLKGDILKLEFQVNRAAVEGKVKTDLAAAFGKVDLHDKIAGVADVISKLGDIQELLAIATGAEGIAKLNVAAILDKEAQSAQPLKDLASALEAKAAAVGVDHKALVDAIKAKAEAIERAASPIDWLAAGADLVLGKKGKKADTKDAIAKINSADDLAAYIALIVPPIISDIGADDVGIILTQAKVDALSEAEKADYESFYADFLAFILKAIQHADAKGIDKTSGGHAALVALRDGAQALLPKLATGGAKKKTDAGGEEAKDPVIAKFDKAKVAAFDKPTSEQVIRDLAAAANEDLSPAQQAHLLDYLAALKAKAAALKPENIDSLDDIETAIRG